MYLYASLLLITTHLSLGRGKSIPLEPFTSVETCLNGAVGIQPSTDSSYSYEVQGNPAFAKYYSATVKDGVLYVQNQAASFTGAEQGNVVVVNVSPDALTSVKATGNGAVDIVSGLSAKNFDLTTTGNGVVNVDLDVSGALTMDASGNGEITVSGSFGTADVTITGNGAVSLYGLEGNAKVDISGNGETYIGGSDSTAITGTKTSLSPLTYQGASCDVTGGSTFSPGCVKESQSAPKPVSLPRIDGEIIGGLSAGSCGVPVSPVAPDSSTTVEDTTSASSTVSVETETAPSSPPSISQTISGVFSALVSVLVLSMTM